MGTSATIMLTSECCRQQSASSDANFLHPPARNSSLRQRISSSNGGSTITYQLSLRIEYVKEPAFLSPHRIPIRAAFKWST
jgi:hypothetical protein